MTQYNMIETLEEPDLPKCAGQCLPKSGSHHAAQLKTFATEIFGLLGSVGKGSSQAMAFFPANLVLLSNTS